jgi:hypothetical protein
VILLFIIGLVGLRIFYLIAEMCYERDWPRDTWKGLLIAFLLLGLCASAFGQAARVDIPLQTSGPNVPVTPGPLPQALWVSNSTVNICKHPTSLPNTVSATLAECQANPIVTYTDSTMSTPCPSPSAQLVQLPGNTCTPYSGVASNVGFWYAGGIVDYWVTSNYGSYGPYTINPPYPVTETWSAITGGTQTGSGTSQVNTLPGVLATGLAMPVNLSSLVGFGDSLMCGGQGNTLGGSTLSSIPYSLSNLLSMPMTNLGVGGNTSLQIAIRQGGISTYNTAPFTLSGTSGITVSVPSGYEPATSQGGNSGGGCYLSPAAGGTKGTWGGVHGTASGLLQPAGQVIFTPDSASSATIPINTNFIVDTPYQNYFQVLESSANDYNAGFSTAQNLAHIAAEVTALPFPKRYVVTSSLITTVYACLPSPSAGCAWMQATNAGLAAAYPNNYVDTLTPLLSQAVVLPPDNIDHTNGVVQTSLHARYDSIQNVKAQVNPGDTSYCNVAGEPASIGSIGYFNSVGGVSGSPEYFQITNVGATNSCTAGASNGVLWTITRGYASAYGGAVASTWPVNSYAGVWDTIHLNGTGYALQAAAINTWYLANAENFLLGTSDYGPRWNTAFANANFLPGIQSVFPGLAPYTGGTLASTNDVWMNGSNLRFSNTSAGGGSAYFYAPGNNTDIAFSGSNLDGAGATLAGWGELVTSSGGTGCYNSPGTIRLCNHQSISGQNAAGTAGYEMWEINSSNQLYSPNTPYVPSISLNGSAALSVHGSSATALQGSDGTGVTGNYAVYAADGSLTNGTGAASRVIAVWSGYTGGSGSQFTGQAAAAYTPLAAITIKRLQMYYITAGVGCSTAPVMALWDASTSLTLTSFTITNGTQTYDSGSLTINVAAADVLQMRYTTAGVGCSTNAANSTFTVQYQMQ